MINEREEWIMPDVGSLAFYGLLALAAFTYWLIRWLDRRDRRDDQ